MKKKKGRPVTNVRLHELMAKHGCSRTWAYKLLKKEPAQPAGGRGDGQ